MSKVHPGFEDRGRIPSRDVHCMAGQNSDQMFCKRCDRTQDVNEPSPRACPLTGRDMRTSGGPNPLLQLMDADQFDIWPTGALLDHMEEVRLGKSEYVVPHSWAGSLERYRK